jgi:hypothetical protein
MIDSAGKENRSPQRSDSSHLNWAEEAAYFSNFMQLYELSRCLWDINTNELEGLFMKKTVMALLCSITLLAGCGNESGSKSQPTTQNANNGNPSASAQPAPAGDAKERLVATYAAKSQDKQLALYSESNAALTAKVTENGGKVENRAAIPAQKDWEKKVQKDHVFVSLPYGSDFCWILLASDPAAGLMEKMLYKTEDNGKSWMLVNDVSQIIDGYVTGVSFRSDKDGWISATQHGTVMVPLYRTKDGGKSWSVQPIPIPQGYKYGNVYPPVFDDKNPNQGSLKVEFVSDADKKIVELTSMDGGDTWKP